MGILSWISAHWAVVGLGVSEGIALIPGIKSNSVIQLCANLLRNLSASICSALGL